MKAALVARSLMTLTCIFVAGGTAQLGLAKGGALPKGDAAQVDKGKAKGPKTSKLAVATAIWTWRIWLVATP